jgi:hypothetical protein
VRTQVDHGLTNASRFDSADSVVSVNDTNYKPGASQPTPLKNYLVPRFESTNEVRRWFSEREITHKVKLVWLPLKDRFLVVITFSCFEVVILVLGV